MSDIEQAREFVGRRTFSAEQAALDAALHESKGELSEVPEVPERTDPEDPIANQIGWVVATLIQLSETAKKDETRRLFGRMAVSVVQAWRDDRWE